MVAIADGLTGEPLYRDIVGDVGMDEGDDFDDCRVAGLHLRVNPSR
jgi:hypothetical protein